MLVTCPCPAAPQHAACPWVALRTVSSYAYPVLSLSCPVAPAHTAPLRGCLWRCVFACSARYGEGTDYSTVGPSRIIHLDHTGLQLPIQSHPTYDPGQSDRHCSCRHHRCHTHPPVLHYTTYTTRHCIVPRWLASCSSFFIFFSVFTCQACPPLFFSLRLIRALGLESWRLFYPNPITANLCLSRYCSAGAHRVKPRLYAPFRIPTTTATLPLPSPLS